MSDGSGVIKIGRKGRQKFQFGDTPEFEIDLVRTHDAWADIDNSYRDAAGNVPRDKMPQYRADTIEFVREVIRRHTTPEHAAAIIDLLTDAECLEFHKHLTERVLALKDFFTVASGKEASPPASTEVKFST